MGREQPGILGGDTSGTSLFKTDAEWEKAFSYFKAFNVDKGIEDIAATIADIRADPACTGKVGAVGFCLGGLLAFLTGTRTDGRSR